MMRAISRLERLCSKYSRRTSVILRMDNLLLAISLAPAKICQSVIVIPRRYALSGRFKLSSLERNCCPVCAGPGDRFAMESVIALPWNRCPVCRGKRSLMLVAPDTSPRDTGISGEADSWDVGTGAGFYLDATQAPWHAH